MMRITVRRLQDSDHFVQFQRRYSKLEDGTGKEHDR